MPFQLSPGVNVTEIDLTTVIPAVATTDAAIGGVFQWGPVETTSLITSEEDLGKKFGRPNSDNYETWMTAASFLAYGNRLHVSRAHHSFGTDLLVSVYAQAGQDYFVIDDSTTSGVETGLVVAASSNVDEAEVTVDTSDVTVTGFDFNAVNTSDYVSEHRKSCPGYRSCCGRFFRRGS